MTQHNITVFTIHYPHFVSLQPQRKHVTRASLISLTSSMETTYKLINFCSSYPWLTSPSTVGCSSGTEKVGSLQPSPITASVSTLGSLPERRQDINLGGKLPANSLNTGSSCFNKTWLLGVFPVKKEKLLLPFDYVAFTYQEVFDSNFSNTKYCCNKYRYNHGTKQVN